MSKEDLAVQVDELMATDKAQEETVHDPLTKLITEGLFIDKTLLIKEFLKDEESHKTYILRPHGFGKSTLLDIIEAMYTDMERLKGTKVYEEGFDESLPVIRIDMQKLIGAFPFPVKLDFNAKTAACVKNLKLLSAPNNKEKDDFGSALFAAFYEQIASGKQAIKPSRTTSSEHNNLERQADAERRAAAAEPHGSDADSTAHGTNLSESTADEPSLASGSDKHSAGSQVAADRYEEDLIASLEALSTLSADAKTNGDKSETSTQGDARAQDDASLNADNSETDVYYQSIDELGRGEAKASYISTEHALKGGSFHSANQANKSSKSGKDHGAVQDKLNGSFEQQDALSDGGVALLDSINENFSYIPSQTSEKSSLFYIAHLLSRCEHRSRVLLIDNFDAPLLATAYEPALYNRRSQVMHYLFTILGTYAHVFRHIIITSTMPYESYGPGMRERNQNDLELDMKFSYSAKCAKMIGVSEEDLLSPQLSKYMSKALSYMQAIHAKYKDKDLAAMHDDARSSFRHISLSMLELFVSGPCPQSTKELASLLSSFYGNFSFDRMTRTMAAVSVVNFLRHPEYGFAPYRYGAAPLDVRYAFDISGSSIADFMQVLSNIFKGEERVLLENATLPNALRPNSVIDRIVKLQRNLYRLKELKEQIIKAKGQGYKGEEIELINERLIYIRDRLNEIKKQMPTERSVSKALAAKVLPQKNASNSGGSVIYESAADTAAPDAASAQGAASSQGAASAKDEAAAAKSSSQASKESESKSAPRHKSPFAIIDDEDELEQATENQESSPSNTNSSSNTIQAYLDEVGESIEAIEQQAAAAMANANLDVQEANALDEDHGTAATNKTNEPSDSNANGQDAAAVPSASDNAQTRGTNSAKSQDGQAAASNDAMSNASVKDEGNAAQSDFSEETMGVITDELADGKIDLIAPVRGRNGQNMESPEEREMMRRMPLGMTLSHLMVAFGYLTTCRYENYELLSTMPNYESYMSLKHAVLETLYAHSDYKRLPKIADNDTVFNGNLKAFLNNLRTVVHSFSYRRSDFVDSQAITACLNLYYAMNHATAPSVATGANVPFLADSVSTTAKKAADRILKDDEEIQRKLNDRLGKNKAAADTKDSADAQDSTDDKSDDRSLKIELAANAKLEFYDACRQERALAKRAANGDANAAKMLEAAREDIKAYDQRAQEIIAAVDNPKIKASDIVLLSEQRAKQNANAAKQDDEAIEQDGKFKSNLGNSKRAMAHAAIGEEHSSLSKDEEILLAKEQEAQAFADVIKAGHEVVCPVVFELDELSDGKAEESLDKDSDDKSDMPVGYMSKQELLAEEQEIKELLKKAYSNLKDSGKVNVSDEQDAILERLISSIGIAFDTRNAEEERSDIAGASRVVDVPEDGVIETFKDRAQERVRSAKRKSKKARSADDAIQLDALEQLGELVASGDNFAEYVSEHDKFVKASSFTLEQFNKSHDEYQKVLKVEEELHGKSDNEKEAIVEEGVNTINELGNIIVSRLKRGADYAKDIDTPAVDNNAAAQSANSTDQQAAASNGNSNSNAKQPQGQHQNAHQHAHQQQRQHEQTASKGVASAHVVISADPDMQDTNLRASASSMSEEDDAKERDEAHEAHMRSIAMSEKIVNLREAITVLKDFAEQISASRKNDGVAFDQSEALNTQESDEDNALASNDPNNQGAASADATDKVNAQAKNSASDKDKDALYQKAVDDTAVALLKDFIKGDNQETAAPTDSGDNGHSVEVSEVQSNNPLKEAASGQSSNVNPVNEYSNLTICRVRVQRGSSFNSAANLQPQTEAQSSGISASTQMALESRDLASSDTSLAQAPSALPEAAKSSTTVNAHPSTAPSTGIAANSIRKCRNLGIRSEYEYVNLEAEVNKEQEDVDAQFEIIDHARNDEERLIIDYAPFLGLRRQAKYLFENFKSYELLYYELNRLKTLAQETEQLSLVHYLDFMLDKIAHTIDVDAFLDMSRRQVEIEVFLERDRNPDWCDRGDLYSVIEDQVHLIVGSKSIKDKYFRLQNLADIATNQGLLFLSGWIWNHQQEYVKFSDQSAKALQAEQGKASAQIQAEAQALASQAAKPAQAATPAQAAQTTAAATADAKTAHAAAATAAAAASAIASAITAAARNSAMSDDTDDNVMGLPSEIAIAQDEAIAKANDRSQKAASMAISANNLRIVGVPGADYEFDDIYADEDLVEEFYDDYFESTFELILEAVYAIVGYKTHYDDINGLTYEDLSPLERQNEQEMKWVTPESIARIAKTWRILKAASVAGEPLTDSHLAFLSTIEAEYHLSQAVKYAITEARSNKPQEDIDIDTILKDARLISKSMFNSRQEELKERRRMQELLVKSVVEALLKKRMPTMNLEAEFEHLNSLPLSVDKILNLRRYMMLARKYNRRDCFDKAATVLKRAIEKIDIEQPGALQERISSVKINSLNFSNKPVEHADDSKQQSLRKLDSQGLLGQLAVFSGPKTGKMRHSNFTVWNNDSAIILEIQTIKNLSEVQDAVKRAMSLIMTVNNPLAEVLGRSAELVANYKVRRIAVVALLTENGIKLVKAMNLDI